MYFTDEGEIWLNVPNLPSGTGKLTIDDHWVASSLKGHSRQALVLMMTLFSFHKLSVKFGRWLPRACLWSFEKKSLNDV